MFEKEQMPTDHAGHPLPGDMDFFVVNPPAIGILRTAYSSLEKSTKPLSTGRRLVKAFAVAIAVTSAGLGILLYANIRTPISLKIWTAIAMSAGFILIWMDSVFRHTLTYVGTEGIARYSCSGTRDNVTEAAVLLFSQSANLRTNYLIGDIHVGNRYSFIWTDDQGKVLYQIHGKSYAAKDFQWGRAAELSWSNWLISRIADVNDVSMTFSLPSRDYVKIEREFVEICVKGNPTRCDWKDIASISNKDGLLIIQRKDARVGWFNSSGRFVFQSSEMANVKVLLHVVEHFLTTEESRPMAAPPQVSLEPMPPTLARYEAILAALPLVLLFVGGAAGGAAGGLGFGINRAVLQKEWAAPLKYLICLLTTAASFVLFALIVGGLQVLFPDLWK